MRSTPSEAYVKLFPPLLALIACGGAPEPESEATPEAATASAPAPLPSGERASGRAELLGDCLATHGGAGMVRLRVSTSEERIATVELIETTADDALTQCLKAGALGIPHTGGNEIVLTAL